MKIEATVWRHSLVKIGGSTKARRCRQFHYRLAFSVRTCFSIYLAFCLWKSFRPPDEISSRRRKSLSTGLWLTESVKNWTACTPKCTEPAHQLLWRLKRRFVDNRSLKFAEIYIRGAPGYQASACQVIGRKTIVRERFKVGGCCQLLLKFKGSSLWLFWRWAGGRRVVPR